MRAVASPATAGAGLATVAARCGVRARIGIVTLIFITSHLVFELIQEPLHDAKTVVHERVMLEQPSENGMEEQALSGGSMGGAVRVGSTVRKAAKPQSATIQRLLTHVRSPAPERRMRRR